MHRSWGHMQGLLWCLNFLQLDKILWIPGRRVLVWCAVCVSSVTNENVLPEKQFIVKKRQQKHFVDQTHEHLLKMSLSYWYPGRCWDASLTGCWPHGRMVTFRRIFHSKQSLDVLSEFGSSTHVEKEIYAAVCDVQIPEKRGGRMEQKACAVVIEKKLQNTTKTVPIFRTKMKQRSGIWCGSRYLQAQKMYQHVTCVFCGAGTVVHEAVYQVAQIQWWRQRREHTGHRHEQHGWLSVVRGRRTVIVSQWVLRLVRGVLFTSRDVLERFGGNHSGLEIPDGWLIELSAGVNRRHNQWVQNDHKCHRQHGMQN